MNAGVYAVYLLAYASMGILPLTFFRRDGKMNARWWLTSLPFIVGFGAVTLDLFGVVHSFVEPGTQLSKILEIVAVPFGVGSTALTFSTMATHRVPLALWHQKDDAPKSIVTYGPYSRVRHPFYVSFLLMLVGMVILSPQIWTILGLIGGFTSMSITAAREERRLLESEFGAEYAAYLKRTGRFFPRLVNG